jgi:phosphoribosylformimino-5-aminoimidazole carboxamide ribotide isomerase
MIIIPAIDIKNGKCVRLYQGRKGMETVYAENPADMAVRWQREGAPYLHVVDLDGAFTGTPQNLDALREILTKVTIPVEFGGGLRDLESIRRVFKIGVDRAILGTAAIQDREFLVAAVEEFGHQVFVGLDVRDGSLAVEGWTKDSVVTPSQMMRRLEEIGAGGIVCTDVTRDGALSGPNIRLLEEIFASSFIHVIASGGVSSVEDIRKLTLLGGGRLYGVIIGKALYTGQLSLNNALEAASGAMGQGRG